MKLILLLIAIVFSINSYSQTWQDVGGGTNNSSHGLITWNNQLINLGSFNNPCNRVSSWDGSSWNCLGGGVGIVARAATIWQGNLVVVGDFWNVQQPCVGCNGVAVWDGTSWSALGNGVNNDVLTCTVWNNELVIGGDFTQADGTPIARIAKWNGTSWESVGPIGSFGNDIRCMTEFEGELWVGGDFNNVGGNPPSDGLVKYDPATANWTGGNSGVDLVGGVNESVRVLYVNPNDGNLYMGGEFPELWDGDAAAQDFNMSGIAMYDGSNWYPLGTGLNEYCRAMHEYNGDIVAGGYFTTAGGVPANKIAKWDGTSWSAMGLGFDGAGVDEYVKSAAVWNGIFFAGGAYTQCEGAPMNYIAQWYEAPTAAPVAWMTTSTTSLCGSGCVEFLDNSTNAPTSWNWSFPGSDVPTSSAQDPGTVCYSSPGTYTATLQACNGIGCTTQNIDIEVTSGATVSVNDEAICGGGPVTLTATPSTLGGTYLWSPGGETTGSISVNPGSTTSYSVSYSYLGCMSSATGTVTVGVGPSVALSGTNSICEGETTILTATPSVGGGTYLWSPGGETTPSITISPLLTTDYTCEYTLNGCTSTPVVETVTVTATPSVNVIDQAICDGGSATLTATPSIGGGTYLWSPGNQTSQSITESPGSTTSYSVVYTLNGCVSASEMATVSVGTTPTLSVNDQTICEGSSAVLSPTPSIGGGSYLWTPTNETTSSITVSPASTTSYDVVYTYNGCPSNTETINVNVTPSPTVSTNNSTICEGQSINLTATPASSGGTYLWSPGGQTSSTISVSPTNTTNYTVVYTLNGCQSSPEISSVTVNTTPTVNVNDESICDGGSATLTATPSSGGGTYLWSPGNQTTPTITESPSTTTTYSVVYTLNGCSSTTELGVINVGTTPSLSVSDETICEGSTVTLSPTPSIGGGTYLWSPTNETTPTINVSPTGTTSYDVTYTLNGCPSNTESITVNVNPTPFVNATSSTICDGETTTVDAIPSIGGGTYLWSPGGETTATISVSPSSTTFYSVVYTLNGCPSTSIDGIVTVNPTPTVSVNDLTLCDLTTGATIDATPSLAGGTYLWSPGGETTPSISVPTASGSYSVIYTLNGCPSAPQVATVTTVSSPDVSVSEVNNEISSAQNGATYQWLDCNAGNAIILGATGQTYAPTINGSYAVQVDLSGCIDTSACTVISTIGLDEINESKSIVIYPNPAIDFIQIKGIEESNAKYHILDVSGRIVVEGSLNKDQTINIKALNSGTYTIVFDQITNSETRFVKN